MEQPLSRPTDTRRFRSELATSLEATEIAELERNARRSRRAHAIARHAACEARARYLRLHRELRSWAEQVDIDALEPADAKVARMVRAAPADAVESPGGDADCTAFLEYTNVLDRFPAHIQPQPARLAPMRCIRARARSRRSRVVRAAAATSGAGDPDPEPERRPRALRSSAGGPA